MKTKRKRVLIIAANDMGKSGVPSVFMSIVRLLSDNYIFDIIVTRQDYYYKKEFISYGGNVYFIEEKRFKSKIKNIFYKLFGSKKQIYKQLKHILSTNQYDIIHSFKEDGSLPYFKIAKKYNIQKRIIHINRIHTNARGLVGIYKKRMKKLSISLATDCVAVSNQSGNSFYGKKTYTTIHNTYDENKYYFIKNESKDFLLIQIGTFIPIKNQLFTLDVLKKLKILFPNVKIVFIGKKYDTNYYSLFEAKIHDLKLEKNVIIYGEAADQIPFLKKATLTLLPSLNEGLPVTAIESQACGIHVISSTGVPNEVDCNNITFIPLDSSLWAETISKFYWMNHNIRKKSYLSNFSNKTFKKQIMRLYSN